MSWLILSRDVLKRFFSDRGTHLAAMVAYYMLLSFFPLLFFALAVIGLSGQAQASSFLVHVLTHVFPHQSIASLVKAVGSVQAHATFFGLAGLGFFIWTSLGLFSVLESAVNIVYRLPNRSFLRGKALAVSVMGVMIITLATALVAGAVGYDLLTRYGGSLSNPYLAYLISLIASLAGVFIFLCVIYGSLPNTHLHIREVLPGAIWGALTLELSFQTLPLYLRYSDNIVSWQALGGPIILLVWLFLMSNIIVLGAEINWSQSHQGGKEKKARRSFFFGDIG